MNRDDPEVQDVVSALGRIADSLDVIVEQVTKLVSESEDTRETPGMWPGDEIE